MDDLTLPGIPDSPSPAPDAAVDRAYIGDDDSADEVNEPSSQELREVVLRARDRFEYEMGVDSDNRDNHLEDLKFAWEKGAQWNEDQRRKRETAKPPRPWLEFNQTGQFVRQIVNDQRQNQPAIKVRPKGNGAKEEIADIISGVIRDIEYNSSATNIYDSDIEQAVTGGRGYHRITTEYESEDSFNQVIRLKPIPDALKVLFDSSSVEPDKSDIKYCFVMEWLDEDTFNAEWPDAASSLSWDFSKDNEFASFYANGKVCVCDYYEIYGERVELFVLSNQQVMWADEYQRTVGVMPTDHTDPQTGLSIPAPQPPAIVRREMRTRNKVKWYKLSAIDKPLEEYKWLGKWIPVVMTPGDEITISGKKIYQGIIRRLRDAQMMYNYWFTLATERIALAPKAPYVMLEGQAENHPEWETANTDNAPYLAYEPVQIGDQWFVTPPARTEAIQIDAGLVTMLQICAQNLREITGMKDAVLGQGRPEQPLGAILAEQKKGDVATFHYGDNLARAIRHTGRILVDLIPKVINVQREVSQLGEDGKQSTAVVNAKMPDGQVINDLSTGDYDVVVDVGPSFASRRVEAAKEMSEFMQVVGPAAAMPVGAIMAQQVDWPGDIGEKVSQMLGSMLPPPQQAILNGDENQDPQVVALQGQIQAQAGQFQQMATGMQGKIAELTQENAKLQLEVANDKMQFAGKLVEQETKRQDMSQARAMEAENNAQQIFTTKLDGVAKMMDNFTKIMQVGGNPAAFYQMAVQAVEGASGELKTGPDFGQAMQDLMMTNLQGNQNVNQILQNSGVDQVPQDQPGAPQGQQGMPAMVPQAQPAPAAAPGPSEELLHHLLDTQAQMSGNMAQLGQHLAAAKAGGPAEHAPAGPKKSKKYRMYRDTDGSMIGEVIE